MCYVIDGDECPECPLGIIQHTYLKREDGIYLNVFGCNKCTFWTSSESKINHQRQTKVSDFSKLNKEFDIVNEKYLYLLDQLKSASQDSLAVSAILNDFQKTFQHSFPNEENKTYKHRMIFEIVVDVEATQRFDEDYLYEHLIDKFYGYDEMVPPASLLGSEIDSIKHFDIDCFKYECKVDVE